MGGPISGVVFRDEPGDAEIDRLDAWLRTIDPRLSDPRQEARSTWYFGPEVLASWHVWVRDSSSLSPDLGDVSGTGDYSISLGYAELGDLDEAERTQWLAQLGYLPCGEIGLGTSCNSAIHHRVLGYLTLRIAEQFGAVINLNGAWCPPMDLDWVPDEDLGGLWKKPATPFRYEGPGRIYEIHYTTGRGTPWYYNLADVEAFRARLADEHFRLIK